MNCRRITVCFGLTLILIVGCRVRDAQAESALRDDQSGHNFYETDCALVARDMVIGLEKAQRPRLVIDLACIGTGLCVAKGELKSDTNGEQLYRVGTEELGGTAEYEVTVTKRVDGCGIKSFRYLGSD